jgi:hypothetical protein
VFLSDLQIDTVLVTDVAGRMEAACSEKWGMPRGTLVSHIDSLKYRGVNRGVIKLAHRLRELRNAVIHHPRTGLADREAFRKISEEVLPILERSNSPEDFADQAKLQLGQDIEEYLDARLSAAFQQLEPSGDRSVESEIDAKLESAFNSAHPSLKSRR